MLFGGEGTIDVMKNLGLTEDEVIGHSMVTRSIRNAQDKIANPDVSGGVGLSRHVVKRVAHP